MIKVKKKSIKLLNLINMKKVFIFALVFLLSVASTWAQAPKSFSYQAVIRNNDGTIATEVPSNVRICIMQGSEPGAVVYMETHVAQSNSNGLITLNIGNGSAEVGNISSINWQNGPFFLKVEVDPKCKGNYSLVSVQQLLSVPYALYAEKAGNAVSQDDIKDLKDYIDSALKASQVLDTNGKGAPVVTTDSTMEVCNHYAKVHGQILSNGGELILSRGFCYGTKPNPTVSDQCMVLDTRNCKFSGSITGIKDSTVYYVRAFATNRYGTAYGTQRTIVSDNHNANTIGIFKVSDSTYVKFAPSDVLHDFSGFADNQYTLNESNLLSSKETYQSRKINGILWRLLTVEELKYMMNHHFAFCIRVLDTDYSQIGSAGYHGLIVIPHEWNKTSFETLLSTYKHSTNNEMVIYFTKTQLEEWIENGAYYFPYSQYHLSPYYGADQKLRYVTFGVQQSNTSNLYEIREGYNSSAYCRYVRDVKP